MTKQKAKTTEVFDKYDFFKNYQTILGKDALLALQKLIENEKYVFLANDKSLLLMQTSNNKLKQVNDDAYRDKTTIEIPQSYFIRLDLNQKIAFGYKHSYYYQQIYLAPQANYDDLSKNLSLPPFTQNKEYQKDDMSSNSFPSDECGDFVSIIKRFFATDY